MRPVIHWFRRDLRLHDNLALIAASSSPVLPLFVIDPALIASDYVGAARLKFLLDGLIALDESLQAFGTRLLVRHGKPGGVIPALVAEVKATALYFNRDYSPYAAQRDARIGRQLNIPVHSYDDAVLLPPGRILKSDGNPYVVYTPFWKQWKLAEKPLESSWKPRAENFVDTRNLPNEGIPSVTDLGFADVTVQARTGEAAARDALTAFAEADIRRYRETRNWLPINPFIRSRPVGSSYLSPYLRFGMLSPRQAYRTAREAYRSAASNQDRESIETWISELAWREFYVQIMHFFPHVMQRDFVDTYLDLQWRDAPNELRAWQEGQTGYPIIDAPMRQLKAIGWMPNRARMIVASFLTKDLLIHWKHGEHHFMKYLIDGDPSANNGGWQWAAGTGTDAQPYFRIFNPVSQSQKFATPNYLRHWLPELREVPAQFIHAPWKLDHPPLNYPPPIVDHQAARERALMTFKAAR